MIFPRTTELGHPLGKSFSGVEVRNFYSVADQTVSISDFEEWTMPAAVPAAGRGKQLVVDNMGRHGQHVFQKTLHTKQQVRKIVPSDHSLVAMSRLTK